MFVDGNHAGNKQTRRSRTGFMICMKFVAEFIAMNVSVDTLHDTKYKLMMMVIPISGPSYFYGGNMLVIHDSSNLVLTLMKKCNAIAYHALHKSEAIKESFTGHIRSEDNAANLLNKVVTGWEKNLLSLVLYDIYDGDT